MIDDANQLPAESQISADLCVVGCGAAGIAVAREFLQGPHSIVVLESGGPEVDNGKTDELRAEIVGLPHAGAVTGRARAFGGTTRLWGGQAIRLDPIDFRERSWVPFSGWPLTRSELDPYYARAERVLNLRARDDIASTWVEAGIAQPAYDATKVRPVFSHWSPTPDFAKTYGAALKQSPNVRVVLRANATGIRLTPNGNRVEQIDFATVSGKRGSVRARYFVICCGGIDTARLLLQSRGVQRAGVGNANDLVGRFFQEHLFIRYGELQPTSRAKLQDLHEPFFLHSLKYAPKLAITEHTQKSERILNVYGDISFEAPPLEGVAAAKALLRGVRRGGIASTEFVRLATRAALGASDVSALAYRYVVKKRSGSPRRGRIFLGGQSEQAPNPSSRITLSDERDELGMPRARIDWRTTELDRRSVLCFAEVVSSELRRLALASFDSDQIEALRDPVRWAVMIGDSGHHMGTARMHDDPKQGVVDARCRVHGVPNLYLGSSAVFPTSGHSNPTLTILALCVRIADDLKRELGEGG